MYAETIDRLGRKRDEAAASQAVRGPRDVRLIRPDRINADYLSHRSPTLNIDAHAITVRYPVMVQFGLSFVNPTAPPATTPRPDPASGADFVTTGIGVPPVLFSDRSKPPALAADVGTDAPVEFYFVRHHRARRYLLRLDGDGRARVTIPRGGSVRAATAFGLRHAQWIAGQRASIRRLGLSEDEQRRLRVSAQAELPARLLELAAVHGLAVARVSVRDQRTRWGSCGRNGNISLNWRLTLMPEWVRDYVMLHELMHLKRLDHSPDYWSLVADVCPDYERARRWLREHGSSLR